MAERGKWEADTDRKILAKLDGIIELLQKMPEVQAAVLLQMNEEYQAARLQGKGTADIWTIAPPNSR